MKTLLFFILLLLQTLMAAETRRIVLPSGETGYSVRCDNENVNACFEAAGEVCHRGYTVLAQNHESGFRSDGAAFVAPLAGGEVGTATTSTKSTTEKSLVIQCKEPELTEAEHLQREAEAAKKAQARKEEEQRQYESGARGARWFFGGILTLVALGVALALFNNQN